MKQKISKILQIIFGLMLLFAGLNHLFGFLAVPEKNGSALELMQAFRNARYIFPVVTAVMIFSGTLLLINKGVLPALLLLLPISFNIFAFHLFHDLNGLLIAWLIYALNMFLIVVRFNQLKVLFNFREGV